MKIAFLFVVLGLSGCGGEVLCLADVESVVFVPGDDCPAPEQVDALVRQGAVATIRTSLATPREGFEELAAPRLAPERSESFSAKRACWSEASTCPMHERSTPRDERLTEAHEASLLRPPSVATWSCRGEVAESAQLVPLSSQCPSRRGPTGEDVYPAKRSCTYRWERNVACVYDRGLGSVGGFGGPGGP